MTLCVVVQRDGQDARAFEIDEPTARIDAGPRCASFGCRLCSRLRCAVVNAGPSTIAVGELRLELGWCAAIGGHGCSLLARPGRRESAGEGDGVLSHEGRHHSEARIGVASVLDERAIWRRNGRCSVLENGPCGARAVCVLDAPCFVGRCTDGHVVRVRAPEGRRLRDVRAVRVLGSTQRPGRACGTCVLGEASVWPVLHGVDATVRIDELREESPASIVTDVARDSAAVAFFRRPASS